MDLITTKETAYEIRDATGRLIARHVRQDKPDGSKDYRWRQPDGTPGLNGTKVADIPLYGAHMANEWNADELVLLVEGEKARDAADEAKFNTVGTVCGASSTPGPQALEVLRGYRVVLWPDNDDPGRKHMDRIAEQLHGIATEVLMYTWDDAPEKGDAADHPAIKSKDPKAVDRLLTDLEGAPRWKPPPTQGIFSAADLMAEELEPVRWVVPDILPEGVSLLAGKPKLGKSWLALGLGIAVASGGAALGTKRVEKGSALYLALEDNKRRLQRRLKKMLAGDGAPEGLHISTGWPRLTEGGLEKLEAWLKDNPDARLVAIDTLAKVRPPARGQNVYSEDYAALEKLLPLAAKYKVAIVVVHHLRKMAAADPLDEISGSTGLSGGVDGFLILKRDRGKADAYLHIDGRDIEDAAELALTWDNDVASWTLVGNADEYRQTEERRQIKDLLARSDGPMSPKDIAEAVDRSPGSVRVMLSEMVKAGQVSNPSYGKYTSIPNTTNSPNSPNTANSPNSSGSDPTVSGSRSGPPNSSGDKTPANGQGVSGVSSVSGPAENLDVELI